MTKADVVLPERRTSVGIVGGGIAGLWAAYQLARAGIRSVVIAYSGTDRGGVQGASRRSAGAINVAPLDEPDLAAYLEELGRGQGHADSAEILGTHLRSALAELGELVELSPIKIGHRLARGPGEQLLVRLARAYESLGGVIVDGWVTRLIANGEGCRGLQYETPLGIGKLRCPNVVLASGGYAGLLGNATRTNCFGTLTGRFIAAGGVVSNLEFAFKHGYGDIDANALTPTEDLPGAEIHASDGQRVAWLEEMLFEQLGTHSHLQATGFWCRNASTNFRVDLRYRDLYLGLWRLKGAIEEARASSDRSTVEDARRALVESFPDASRGAVDDELGPNPVIDFALFERLKPWLRRESGTFFRVAPLTYFTMGGMAHSDLRTSLPGVLVTGEAMHDFGANRVGGLPWGLYLAAGYRLRERLLRTPPAARCPDFELVPKRCSFDGGALAAIQSRMATALEGGLSRAEATNALAWMRRERRALRSRADELHDAHAWYLLGEAILQSALCRPESRGFFFRGDHPEEDPRLQHWHSRAEYDASRDEVRATLCRADDIAAECSAAWLERVPLSASRTG